MTRRRDEALSNINIDIDIDTERRVLKKGRKDERKREWQGGGEEASDANASILN